ncbi:UNKNOWN [Stylonychia lemnae]|uniref:Calpain catalytic domain-containing protein n=1 Tax=Stylonychia lemnae TaxID=5949 RepID=A0A077ZUH0_STYLE|nr:UNKNOWN [Stylonychia lemnae]|eukprot:CDW73209.1 UNKNOWN [Stylonychia lemnae]
MKQLLFTTTFLIVFGFTQASVAKNRMKMYMKQLAQQQQQLGCETSMNRFKSGPPDYENIIKNSNTFWNDTSFPADATSIQWTDTPYTRNGLYYHSSAKWSRLNDLCPNCTMFGTGDYLNDISQGAIGDCYFMAGATAVAEIDNRFKKIFVNPEINWAGLYAFNVYVRGIPHVMVVDDAVPAGSQGLSPSFAEIGSDGSIWGPLLEKAWAKFANNYEFIVGGSPNEVVQFLTNSPTTSFKTNQLSLDAIWKLLSQSDIQNNIMNVVTNTSGDAVCPFNLACQHVYTLLGVATVYNADKTQVTNLYRIRNPWKVDAGFNGTFSDNASVWNTVGFDGKTYAQQAGHVIADDGIFWTTPEEFVQSFINVFTGEYRDEFVTSWYDKVDDQVANSTNPSKYAFTITESTPMTIRVVTYPVRMYPVSCKKTTSIHKVVLKNSRGNWIDYIQYLEVSTSFMNLIDRPLAPGTYTIEFYPSWTEGDIKDYEFETISK